MALADRDYYGEPERRRSSSQLTPMVKALLIANISIYLLDYVLLQLIFGTWLHPIFKLPRIASYFCFTLESAVYDLRLWEFITFQFLHGGFLHLLFNSFGLFFFGPWLERHLGSRHFIIYYLLCGIAGGAFYTLLGMMNVVPTEASTPFGMLPLPLVGASAGIYGIFIGVAIIAPNMRVQLLFPPIPMSMRTLAISLMVIATGVIFLDLRNAGGEAGHLGGAILGFILMRYAPWLGRNPSMSIRRPSYRRRFESKLSPRSEVDLKEVSEIDAILDKVSAEGFQSLSDAEKAILRKAAGEKEP